MKTRSILTWAGFGVAIFFLFWGLESFLGQCIPSEKGIEEGSFLAALYPSLPEKLALYGKPIILEYLAQIKLRAVALVGFFAFLVLCKENRAPENKDTDLLWRIRLFFGVQLIYLPDLLKELTLRFSWREFYTPLPLFSGLAPTFPPVWILQFLVIFIFAIAAYFILTQWQPTEKLPAVLATISFIFWTYLLIVFFGFGKIDHTYASLFSAQIFLIIWLFHWQFSHGEGSFGHRIFQAGIWGCYFFSGLEKLFLSGWQWCTQEHFELLIWLHPTPVGLWISGIPGLGSFVLFAALIFQLSALAVWVRPKWGYGFGICAIFFHLGTWMVLGVGGWQSPWILMALFLFPIYESKKISTP